MAYLYLLSVNISLSCIQVHTRQWSHTASTHGIHELFLMKQSPVIVILHCFFFFFSIGEISSVCITLYRYTSVISNISFYSGPSLFVSLYMAVWHMRILYYNRVCYAKFKRLSLQFSKRKIICRQVCVGGFGLVFCEWNIFNTICNKLEENSCSFTSGICTSGSIISGNRTFTPGSPHCEAHLF